MKLCLTCAHFQADPLGDKCTRRIVTDPVRGTSRPLACMSERNWDGPNTCGPDAKFHVERVAIEHEGRAA